MLLDILTDEDKAQIDSELPSIKDLLKESVQYGNKDSYGWLFFDKPRFPPAGVCLRDAISILDSACYAMRQALLYKRAYELYKDSADKPRENTTLWYMRFYADDVALRLYAVGEDMAEAIINLMEFDRKKIIKNYGSKQKGVNEYLAEYHPAHAFTKATRKLLSNNSWLWVKRYRNTWVHDQPPAIEGFSIQYNRNKTEWIDEEQDENGENQNDESKPLKTTYITEGDTVNLTIVELINYCLDAITDITDVISVIAETFTLELNKRRQSTFDSPDDQS